MSARGAAILAVAAALLVVAAPANAENVRVRAAASAASAGYWTPERMARARPLELVRSGGRVRARLARNHPHPFTSGAVADPTVFPNSATGKLFGRLRGLGAFECSATVLDTASGRVILTAGHCVFEPSVARFAKRLTFVPAYANGAEPLGRWGWSSLETTREWVLASNTNFDFAVIVLRKQAGSRVEEVAGGLPLAAGGPREQNYRLVGYPHNLGAGRVMWSCSSSYAGDDPRPFAIGPPPIAAGCDMGFGASGGGWMTDAGGIASLSSFGYRGHPDILYGPYLARKAVRMVARNGSR
jgi:V8-like Glu-specific endopeptidase